VEAVGTRMRLFLRLVPLLCFWSFLQAGSRENVCSLLCTLDMAVYLVLLCGGALNSILKIELDAVCVKENEVWNRRKSGLISVPYYMEFTKSMQYFPGYGVFIDFDSMACFLFFFYGWMKS